MHRIAKSESADCDIMTATRSISGVPIGIVSKTPRCHVPQSSAHDFGSAVHSHSMEKMALRPAQDTLAFRLSLHQQKRRDCGRSSPRRRPARSAFTLDATSRQPTNHARSNTFSAKRRRSGVCCQVELFNETVLYIRDVECIKTTVLAKTAVLSKSSRVFGRYFLSVGFSLRVRIQSVSQYLGIEEPSGG